MSTRDPMQDRQQIQQLNTPQEQIAFLQRQATPGSSPWMQSSGISPAQGSLSMQREANGLPYSSASKENEERQNALQKQQHAAEPVQDAEDEEEEAEKKADRLSSEFSLPVKIFWAALIVLTMGSLVYGNTQVGAYVQVQVTPKLPTATSSSSFQIVENVSPLTATLLSYTSPIANQHEMGVQDMDIEESLYKLIVFVKEMQTKYPHFKISNDYAEEIDIDYLYEHRINITQIIDNLNINMDETLKYDVFSFTLVSSIDDFWAAKAYSLAFVIAAFSGAWPYIKLLLLLVIWLHPIRPKQRKKGLFVLDQLGKYSFIDLYVCIFMVVSFYLTITEELQNGLGVEVAVVVELDIGVTLFAIITLLSMVYSMMFIFFDEQKRHKKQEEHKQKESMSMHKDEDQNHAHFIANDENHKMEYILSDKLDTDCFEHEIEPHSKLYEWKYHEGAKIYAFFDLPDSLCGILWRGFFLTLLLGNIWLCVDAIWTAPVRYNMNGLAGWAVSDNIRSYSIIKTVNLLPFSTDEWVAAWFCVVQYYMTVVLAPLLISAVLVFVWLCPMSYRTHNIICHLLYPLQAWNALDVFLVGTVAASIELDQVSQWILNTNYPTICGTEGYIEDIVHVGCFSVKGYLTYGCLMLGIYVVLEWFLLIYTSNRISNTHKKFASFKYAPVEL
mmetsp:Transcript_8254/g.13489  ORF Transcript_8254/g.13489 Transcript_8254/m.13489 type:complete len:670 (+) Transcript_8254:46-2055(+)